MRRSRHLDEILRLDPVREHKRIVHLDICYKFPFDTTRSLELALFRTFASPAVAELLDATGEFSRAPQKRYDDTDLLISTFLEDGYDSESGREADRERGLSLRSLHVRLRADPLERALRVAADGRGRADRPLPLLA